MCIRSKATGTKRKRLRGTGKFVQAGLPPRPGGDSVETAQKKIAERAVAASGITVTFRVAGPFPLLDKLSRLYGIEKLLKKCFPGDCDLIFSLVYYIVHRGGALSRTESWSRACLHPFGDVIASQRVSELLCRLTEDGRQRFLSFWLEHIRENDWLCYDITSVSSYARHNEYTYFDYNRDGESLEQINLAMLFGQKKRLPVYYRRMPRKLIGYKNELLAGKSVEEHEDFYRRYLVVRGTPKRGLRVDFNEEEMETMVNVKYANRYGQVFTESTPTL